MCQLTPDLAIFGGWSKRRTTQQILGELWGLDKERRTEIREDQVLGVAIANSLNRKLEPESRVSRPEQGTLCYMTCCDSSYMFGDWIACKQVDLREDDFGLWLWPLLWVGIAHCSRAFIVLGRGSVVGITCSRPASIQGNWVLLFPDFKSGIMVGRDHKVWCVMSIVWLKFVGTNANLAGYWGFGWPSQGAWLNMVLEFVCHIVLLIVTTWYGKDFGKVFIQISG